MIDNACEWGAATMLIFSENVGQFIYYTHVFPLVISLFLGFFVLINNPARLANRVLFFTTTTFVVWVYFDLILWASPTPELVMFFWSLIVPVEFFMYLGALYLIYIFTRNQTDAPTWLKLIFLSLTLPVLLLAHTSLNVIGLSPDCDTGAYEGIIVQYMYTVEVLLILIGAYLIFTGRKYVTDVNSRKQMYFIGFSTLLFLIIFTIGNLTLFFDLGPYYEQYKLFGMPVFATLVGYSIVKFKAFTKKELLSQLLISALWILMFSILLFRDFSNARPIILVTLVLFAVLGVMLSKVIQREIEQKNQIEKLAKDLERANVRLKELDKQKSEFVSIASHQLRSPLTAIRGYASMLADGSYGTLSSKMIEPINRIQDASRLMAESIEDFLNVSRIEGGNMKYELSDFNLRDRTERLVDDLRPEGFKKGLLLLFKQDLTGTGVVHADVGKTEQILHNLINNALKYTPKGTITVFVHDDPKKKLLIVDVLDTGIGMSEETIMSLFEKFTRAKNANSVNIKGTGLGLYVAREMARKMGGDITAHSEGEGKGSRFTFTIPTVL